MANEQDGITCDSGNIPAHWKSKIARWLNEYPASDRSELKSRLASRNSAGGYFELLLHALLKRHDARIKVHPTDASGNSKRPDFLASFPNGQKVIVEAVTVKDFTDSEESMETAWADLCNHINQLASDFWIDIIRHPGTLSGPPPPRRVTAFLKKELDKLNIHEARWQMENAGAWRDCVFCDGDKRIEFRLRPKMEAHRGTTQNTAGMGGYRWAGPVNAIKQAVDNKATRYGEIEHAYVVVVGVTAFTPWDYAAESAGEALFGDPLRGLGGAFVRSDGKPLATRVSGVAIGSFTWNLGAMRMVLYENPRAQRPICAAPWQLDRMVGTRPDSVLREGKSVGEVLELPKGWPESHG